MKKCHQCHQCATSNSRTGGTRKPRECRTLQRHATSATSISLKSVLGEEKEGNKGMVARIRTRAYTRIRAGSGTGGTGGTASELGHLTPDRATTNGVPPVEAHWWHPHPGRKNAGRLKKSGREIRNKEIFR